MNVPTVIYWNPNHWELRETAIPYFEELKRVKVFHETPESAARHVAAIWHDVDAWWVSPEVGEVVDRFKAEGSNTGQTADELADAMQRTQLNDGSVMLPNFHVNGKLTKVKTSDVEMTPDMSTTIGLDELNKVIAEQKGVSVADLAVGGTSVEEVGTMSAQATTMPSGEAAATVNAANEKPLSDEDLARNMRADADRMFKEAERLRKEAEDLSPSKKAKSSAKG